MQKNILVYEIKNSIEDHYDELFVEEFIHYNDAPMHKRALELINDYSDRVEIKYAGLMSTMFKYDIEMAIKTVTPKLI